MPPGGAFQTQAQPPASASAPEETGRQVKGMGSEHQSWPCCLYQETLAPPSLTGPQPLGLTQGFAKQVSHNHGQASTHGQAYMQGLKRFCQRMLSRAAGKQLCPGPQCMPAESQEPQQQAASLHPLAKQKAPYTPQGRSTFHLPSPRRLPARGMGDRNQRPYSWAKWVNEGQAMERSGHLPWGPE